MALAKKCDRCGKLYEHYGDFNSYMVIVTDKYGHIGATSKKNDLCPDCMQALTDFMEAPQREINDSKESLTPELVTGTIGQVLDECTLDGHARKLLDELYQTALAEVQRGVTYEKDN